MKKHHMPEMKEGGVNVTPLIDVVMCLIIFFILVAKIGVADGINKDIDAPKTYLGVKVTDMANLLTLNLYEKKGAVGDEPQILVDLKGEKQKELQVQTKDGKKPLQDVLKAMKKDRGDQFKLGINADAGMKYASIQLILQEAAMAGVSNIVFATRKHSAEAP